MSYNVKDAEALNIGDIIYECEAGLNIKAEVTSKPVTKTTDDGKKQVSWTAINFFTKKEIGYMLTEGYEHYIKIYKEPQYFLFTKNGPVVKFLGEDG